LADNLAEVARAQEIPLKMVQFTSLSEMRQRAPSAYGTFAISCKGHVLSHLYHRMSGDRLAQVRHGAVREPPNPCRISLGDRRVCTTF
jgi:hypothetical protein